MRLSRCLLFLFLLLLLLPLPAAGQAPDWHTDAEILWDVWGVPHIYAADNNSLFYAAGWAQAHNHADLILKLYGEARGRAAEYWGPAHLERDMLTHTLGIPQHGQDMYNAQDAEWKSYADHFAAGFNAYAAAHPESISEQYSVVLPVSGTDVMAHGARTLYYEFVARSAIGYARRWAAAPEMGSNAWAIAPSRSADGRAMLVINPHQPWSDLGLWIEMHFITPELNLYGAALVGNPVLGVGFNDFLGWAMTVNTHDGWDLYTLTLQGDGYLFDGQVLPFTTREVTLLAPDDEGQLQPTTFTVRESLHGPLLAERGDGTALALRVVGRDRPWPMRQWWQMGQARNLAEFEAALAQLQIPMFTIMYADRDGNIMHLFNEQVPLRQTGDWAFWNNTTRLDETSPAFIPGDTAAYLWDEYHPYEDLPRVLNPASGWLQNANEPPWTTTYPLELDPANYPAYIAPPPYVWPRPSGSLRLMLTTFADPDARISFDELVRLKHSTDVELANQILDDLLAAAADSSSSAVQNALEVLQNWDRRADADSVGAVLFALWVQAYIAQVGFDIYATPWDISDPLNTPHGLSQPEVAVRVLGTVASQLEMLRPLGGGIDVPWGNVFRLRYGSYDLPANGANDILGTFRILTSVQDPDLRFRAVHGDSFIAVVAFGETGPQAEVLLSYGNATQPGSPHVGDQLTLFAAQELRPAWRTREEVLANLAQTTRFDE